MKGADDRRARVPQDEPRQDRRQRFVDMEHVERRRCEQSRNPASASGIQTKPGLCAADSDDRARAERDLTFVEGGRRGAVDRHFMTSFSECARLRTQVRRDSSVTGEVVRREDAD